MLIKLYLKFGGTKLQIEKLNENKIKITLNNQSATTAGTTAFWYKYNTTTTVEGSSADSVVQILEKNGISAPARCRSGECGFCHSHLISGKIYVPKHLEYRRLADYKFDCIHPCCSFPLTDLEINVPPAK